MARNPDIAAGIGTDPFARLVALETGELDATAARELLRGVLDAHPDEEGASEVFASLRSWTGRMLRGSAGGDDLRPWHALLKAVGAQFRGARRDYAVRIDVLADMIHERVALAESRGADAVLARRHVRPALAAMARAKGGRLARAELGDILRLEQANLTRVTTMIVDAGLASRTEDGRTVAFELTAEGLRHARVVAAPRSSREDARVEATGPWMGPDPVEVALAEHDDRVPSAEAWSHLDVRQDVWEQREAA